MLLNVRVTYGDDKIEGFVCTDYPTAGEYVVLYMQDLSRVMIKSNTITRIEISPKTTKKYEKARRS